MHQQPIVCYDHSFISAQVPITVVLLPVFFTIILKQPNQECSFSRIELLLFFLPVLLLIQSNIHQKVFKLDYACYFSVYLIYAQISLEILTTTIVKFTVHIGTLISPKSSSPTLSHSLHFPNKYICKEWSMNTLDKLVKSSTFL